MMLDGELKEKMLTEIIFNKSRFIFEGTFYEHNKWQHLWTPEIQESEVRCRSWREVWSPPILRMVVQVSTKIYKGFA